MNVFIARQPGDKNRPTVFFVHGSMANYLQFESLIESLRGDYNIVAFDAYGCGKSEKPQGWEEYSADEHLEDVKTIVQKYKTSTNHVICHSFGTSQGIRLANLSATLDIKLNSLILLGTALTLPDGGHPLFRLPLFFLNWIQPWLTSQFAGIAFHEDCSPDIIEKSSEQSSSNPMHVCQAFYRQFKWCTAEEVAGVTCPVLILQGSGDRLTPVSGAKQLQRALQNCDMHLIEKAGHQVMQEAPEAVLGHITPFLASASRESSQQSPR